MNGIHDIPLPQPIAEAIVRGLLFGAFALHLLFVLMMLGTGMLAFVYFLRAWWGKEFAGARPAEAVSELRWDKRVLRTFLIHKSLAVVLGVGPLLLIQVAFAVPFFTALTLLAPFWLLIIVLVITASLAFDALGHKAHVHHYIHLGIGLVAMVALLAIPGLFVAVLASAENSQKWTTIVREGFAFDAQLALHWAFRYLHVLGAAVVFASAFHYFFTAGKDAEKRKSLLRWMLGGLLAQAVTGIGLFLSLLQEPTLAIGVYLTIGAALTGVFMGLAAFHAGAAPLSPKVALPGLLVLLVAMLLVRQGFQDRAFGALIPSARKNAEAYESALGRHSAEAVKRYTAHIQLVYDNGPTIYSQSCSFCHGPAGKGDGEDARLLRIPPERLEAVRSTRAYLYDKVSHGVPGSAMPYFYYFSPPKRERVVSYLNQTWNVLSQPSPVPVQVSKPDMAHATKVYNDTCSQCHGLNGRGGTPMSAGLRPPPPDFTAYSLQPQQAFDVITNGYPGTAMPAYGNLPEGARWGLVKTTYEQRSAQSAPAERDRSAGSP